MAGRPTRQPVENLRESRLFAAIRNGDLDGVASMLNDLGPEMVLSMSLPGLTVMQAAVDNGQEKILRRLLKEGADANETLWNGDTLLHIAVKQNRTSIVRLLLEHGAGTATANFHDQTVIHIAMTENMPDMARALLAHGNDPVHIAERAIYWIGKARESGLQEMVTALEDLTESFSHRDPAFNLYAAIVTKNHGRVVDLLDQHVDPFGVKLGKIKMSPLHAAARQSDVRLLAMLLSRLEGIRLVNTQDARGQTPLHYAAAKNNEENVDWLVFSGADPNIEDESRKRAENLATDAAVTWILTSSTIWDSVPDTIIVMRGEWSFVLTRTDCTLSHSQVTSGDLDPPSDDGIAPVLMFRRTTREADEGDGKQFEQVSFGVKETCWELYEYRCSQRSCMCFSIDLSERSERSFDPDTEKLILKHKVAGQDCTEQELTLRSDRQSAECDVSLSDSGKLALVCRVEHTVATVPIGPEEADIRPEEFPGLELEISPDTFHERQDILIMAEEPPPLPSTEKTDSDVGPSRADVHADNDADVFPIKSISCFYNIINSESESPHKSIRVSIPLKFSSNNVMSFLLRRAQGVSIEPSPGIETLRGVEELQLQVEEPEQHPAQPAPQPPDDEDAGSDDVEAVYEDDFEDDEDAGSDDVEVDYEDDFEDDEEPHDVTNQPTWTQLPEVTAAVDIDVVRTNIQDMGVVVAAEVCPGVRSEDVIRAIQDMYLRQQKKEISIFSVAKPAPSNRVEVMLCCVSEDKYDTVLARLEGQGYRSLQEPIVAYAHSRETFLLTLRGNLTDIYADGNPTVLEYQVGGRLNYAAFLLEVTNQDEAASGMISITRDTSENSQHAAVGRLHLDATSFFPQRQTARSTGQLSDIDQLQMRIAKMMNTDFSRLYCYALGLTKHDLKAVQRLPLSPSERIFRMLSLTRSMYRSEAAFFNHLLDVLQKHNETQLVDLLEKSLRQMKLN